MDTAIASGRCQPLARRLRAVYIISYRRNHRWRDDMDCDVRTIAMMGF